MEQNLRPELVTWDAFKRAFQGKYIGASYIEARQCEYMKLEQGDRSVVKYEGELLRLSRYVQALVATEYDKCVRFKEGLRYELRVLIASERERVFVVLVDKVKFIEEVKRIEREKKEQKRAQGRVKRETGFTSVAQHSKKWAILDGPPRTETSVGSSTIERYDYCGRCHVDK